MLGGIVRCPGQARPRKNDLGCTEEELVPGKPAGVVAWPTGGTIVVGAVEEAARVGCADIVDGAFSIGDKGHIEWQVARLGPRTCNPFTVGVPREPETVIPEPVRRRAVSKSDKALLLRHLFGKCPSSGR